MVQVGFWLSSTPSKTTCATQEQDKSMKGMFWSMGKVEVGLRMKMNKGRGSAQRGSAPWGMMKLEVDSTYRRSNGRTEEHQQQ